MALSDVSCSSQAVTLQSTNDLSDDLCDKISDALASNFLNCQYYDFDLSQMNWSNGNNVIILHVNIRSLQKYFDCLCEFVESLTYTPDIICLTEARIKYQPLTNLNLPNYHFTYVSPSTNAGGVAAYISDNLQFNLSAEQYVLAGAEFLWITINCTKLSSTFKQIIIVIIYCTLMPINLNFYPIWRIV